MYSGIEKAKTDGARASRVYDTHSTKCGWRLSSYVIQRSVITFARLTVATRLIVHYANVLVKRVDVKPISQSCVDRRKTHPSNAVKFMIKTKDVQEA